jgi:hypothetical protein
MRGQSDPRRVPFAVAAALLLVVTIAVFRLPEAFVADMKRDGLITGDSADLAFAFIATMAFGQAAYVGYVILSPERIADAGDPTAVARFAAGMASLTLVYAVAAFVLTGLRAGFWYFVILEIAQGAWYYRQVGSRGGGARTP